MSVPRNPHCARLLALLLASIWGLAVASAPAAAEPSASLPDIEDEVMCPICGTPLNESQSPQADRERALIRRLIDQGRDKEEIEDALVDQYGPHVLATPRSSGFDLTAWLVPGLGGLLALAAIGFAVVRLRRRGRVATPEPRALDPEDEARLERDMSSYEA
jgi:cytochrome c-type biogenesis protein CcmH